MRTVTWQDKQRIANCGICGQPAGECYRICPNHPGGYTEAEWSVMLSDPAFGYVRRCGHKTTIVNGVLMDDDCLICEMGGME